MSSEWFKLRVDGKVCKKLVKEGEKNGEKPDQGHLCEIQYRAWTGEDNVFEECSKPAFQFTVGNFPVVKGMDFAVQTMTKGETAAFKFHPDLAYRKQPRPDVPPTEDVFFEVTLLDFYVQPFGKLDFRPQQDLAPTHAENMKLVANQMLSEGKCVDAITEYEKALNLIEDIDSNETKRLRIQIQNNICLALLKQNKYKETIEACQKALTLDPKNDKAFIRIGKSHRMMRNFKEALENYNKAQNLLPNDAEIKKEIQEINKEIYDIENREKIMIQKMFEKGPDIYGDRKMHTLGDPSDPIVYLQIRIAASRSERIHIQLFSKVVPLTAENFLTICKGSHKSQTGKILTYRDTTFHRLIKGFMIQGGDVDKKDGTGGMCIYEGGVFPDEGFSIKHDRRGLLSMANAGPNTNTSQFFITFAPCPHLDNKNVVFGKILDNEKFFAQMENVPVDPNSKQPLKEIRIIDCGIPTEVPKF